MQKDPNISTIKKRSGSNPIPIGPHYFWDQDRISPSSHMKLGILHNTNISSYSKFATYGFT